MFAHLNHLLKIFIFTFIVILILSRHWSTQFHHWFSDWRMMCWCTVFWISMNIVLVILCWWIRIAFNCNRIRTKNFFKSFRREFWSKSYRFLVINIRFLKSFEFFCKLWFCLWKVCKVKIFDKASFFLMGRIKVVLSNKLQLVYWFSSWTSWNLFIKERRLSFKQSHVFHFHVNRLWCKFRIEMTRHKIWSPWRFNLHSAYFIPINIWKELVGTNLFPILRSFVRILL